MTNTEETKPVRNDSATKFWIFKDTHQFGEIRLSNHVRYSQRQIIEENIMDRNFTFSVPFYSDGTEKMFFSLPYILAEATYRNTDMDTKDVQVKADNYEAAAYLPLVEGALRNYLKVINFEETMNDVRKELIDMGHVITKEVYGETKIVNLLHIIRPAEIMDLQDGGLAEIRYLTWEEMQLNKEEWKDEWDKVLQLKDILDSTQRKTFKIYDWCTVDTFNGRETKGCIRFLDITPFEAEVKDLPEDWVPVCELERFVAPYDKKIEDKNRLKRMRRAGIIPKGSDVEPLYPYMEERLFKIPGRWMGMGYYELLRNEGKAFNKTLNEKLRYDELLHKGILVRTKAPYSGNSQGRSIENDIINKIQTGTIISIKAGEKLDRLNLGSLTADFLATAETWFKLGRQKVGVSETSIGDRLPSSTTATVGVINERQSKNAFDIVNEQQGIFFKNLFTDLKIKDIIEDLTEDEWTKLSGSRENFRRMEAAFIDNLVNTKVANAAKTGRFLPDGSEIPPEELDRIKESVAIVRDLQGENRFAQLKKEILKNFNFNISFVVNNDAFDRQIVLNSIQAAIDTVSASQYSEIDMDKLIEMKLSLMNLNYQDLRKSPEKLRQEASRQVASQPTVESEAKQFGQANQMSV